jgi:tetratricopeptide (TPR) repeat protein
MKKAIRHSLEIIATLTDISVEERGMRTAWSYYYLGQIAQEQRQWAQAEQHYQQALQIFIEFNDSYNQAQVYLSLGVLASEEQHWVQAEQYCQQALQIFIEFNDRHSQLRSYRNLGLLAEEQLHWVRSRDYFLKSLEISAEYNDTHGLGITLRSLARLWRSSGDADLPAAVAALLGITPAEVEELLRKAAGEEGAAG